jgi:nitrous oxidase accessory protein NosD
VQTIVGAHGATSDTNRTTIRGDYAADPGTIAFSVAGWLDAGPKYTTFKSLSITSTASGYSCLYVSASDGVVVDGCTLVGGYTGVGTYGGTVFASLTVKNNVVHGQELTGIGYDLTVASSTATNIVITGNTVYSTGLYGIQLTVSSTNSAWASSLLNNCLVANNTVHDTPGTPILLRSCNSDAVTAPSVYSSGLVVSGNTIYDCGTIAGDNGNHGGMAVSGFVSPLITGNTVRDCYVTGAGIQTAKNKYALITFNTISGIRSGTPTASFQNGFPIDGNGIFFDDLSVGGLAYGNYISNLVSTGNPNSGTGLSFWTATGSRFVGNVVVDCYVGANYGHASETDNQILNNTFINCTIGVTKIGTSAQAGNVTAKNNILHHCTTGFSMGANPSITADYNNVYGHVTAYSGISAGANDKTVDPLLTTYYKPTAASLLASASPLDGLDFYGIPFKSTPNFGAVETTTPRSASSRTAVDSTLRPVSTRVAVRRGATQ